MIHLIKGIDFTKYGKIRNIYVVPGSKEIWIQNESALFRIDQNNDNSPKTFELVPGIMIYRISDGIVTKNNLMKQMRLMII